MRLITDVTDVTPYVLVRDSPNKKRCFRVYIKQKLIHLCFHSINVNLNERNSLKTLRKEERVIFVSLLENFGQLKKLSEF